DMLDNKGSLEYLPIYSFLFSNEKSSSLFNAFDRNEVEDKLVIKIDQVDRAPKFSIADDISVVYGLPRIHKCINGQKPLRAVIDIDASKKDMETANVKGQEVFIRICCSFIRGLYQILDCGWKDILKGLVIATSSYPSKCSYHILYAPILLIDHHELKAFTELVYTITGEKYDNGWNELDHTRVQPPISLCLEHSIYLKDWTIEEKKETKENFVYFNWKGPLECPLCKRSDEPEKVFECDPSITEKIRQENKKSFSSPSIHKIKGPATETYEEIYVRPLPDEGDIYVGSSWETGKTYILKHLTISDNVNLLVLSTRYSYSNAVTTRLNLKSYCDINGNINLSDHKRVVCQIESLHRITNN
ncbi:9565_t:CDS:2, partial [Funneliformis geosporum]